MTTRAALLDRVTAIEQDLQQSTALDSNEKKSFSDRIESVKEDVRAFIDDRTFYRIVVIGLCVAMVAVIFSITFLTYNGKTSYEALTAIGSAAVGALAGLLAPSPVQK